MSIEAIAMGIFGMITGWALTSVVYSLGIVAKLSKVQSDVANLKEDFSTFKKDVKADFANFNLRIDSIRIITPPCEFERVLEQKVTTHEAEIENLKEGMNRK